MIIRSTCCRVSTVWASQIGPYRNHDHANLPQHQQLQRQRMWLSSLYCDFYRHGVLVLGNHALSALYPFLFHWNDAMGVILLKDERHVCIFLWADQSTKP